jgi:hypothetical protein
LTLHFITFVTLGVFHRYFNRIECRKKLPFFESINNYIADLIILLVLSNSTKCSADPKLGFFFHFPRDLLVATTSKIRVRLLLLVLLALNRNHRKTNRKLDVIRNCINRNDT